MYNFDEVGKACLMIADELAESKDKEARKIIKLIDEADGDKDIKEGIRQAVTYLQKKKKFHIADEIQKKTKGFAF